jgi:WW domain-containing oxidoreductase
MLKGTGPSGFGYSSTAEEVTERLDLGDKTILITGCNSGVGNECARVLSMRGATVLGAARNEEKARRACDEMPGEAIPVACELGEPESVRSCVEEVVAHGARLDALICNAGIMALPELERIHGYEKQFFVNHVGHFILVTGLLDQLADRGRVVMLSSEAHNRAPDEGIAFDNLDGSKDYDAWEAYGQSKLANLLCAKELARRFEQREGDERIALAVHPGVINTNLGRHMNALMRVGARVLGPLAFKDEREGAATQTWAAVHPDAAEHNGAYLADCNVKKPSRHARDPELARELWERTEEIVEEVT